MPFCCFFRNSPILLQEIWIESLRRLILQVPFGALARVKLETQKHKSINQEATAFISVGGRGEVLRTADVQLDVGGRLKLFSDVLLGKLSAPLLQYSCSVAGWTGLAKELADDRLVIMNWRSPSENCDLLEAP